MKLLVDMNLSPSWVSFLNELGFETKHWIDVGLANASDADIMAYARDRGFVILTHDLDFGAILAATGGKAPSVVQIRSDNLGIDLIGRPLVAALRQTEDQLKVGALVTLDTDRARVSLLPIGGL